MITHEQIEDYKQIEWEALLHKKAFNKDHNLEEIKPALDVIKNLFDSILLNDNFQMINHNTSHSSILIDYYNQLIQLIEYLRAYSDISRRDEYIKHVWDKYGIIAINLLPVKQALDFLSQDAQKDTPSKHLHNLKEIVEKAKTLLSEQQALSIKSTAETYGNIFLKESQINGKEARQWLWCFIGSVVIAIVFALLLMFGTTETSEQGFLNFILNSNNLGKLFIFSMLFFGTSVFKTNYMSMKHQKSLNMHRHNAVTVYNQMVTSVQKTQSESEKETLNTLLLELSRAIFDSKDTGYTKSSSIGHFPTNLINFSKHADKK